MFYEKMEKPFNVFKRQDTRLKRLLQEPTETQVCTRWKETSLRIMAIIILMMSILGDILNNSDRIYESRGFGIFHLVRYFIFY